MKRLPFIFITLIINYLLLIDPPIFGMNKANMPKDPKKAGRICASQFNKAIKAGDALYVKDHIKDPHFSIHAYKGNGDTFLHIAVEKWSYWQLKIESATHSMAAEIGEIEYYRLQAHNQEIIIQLLIEHGARVNHKNRSGLKPFDEAPAIYNQFVLLPLKESIKKHDDKTLLKLIKQGADINTTVQLNDPNESLHHRHPLLSAVCCHNKVAFKILLDHGADPFLKAAFLKPVPLIREIYENSSNMAECVFKHIPKRTLCSTWNTVVIPWLLIGRRLTQLSKDLRFVIGEKLLLLTIIDEHIKRTHALIECIDLDEMTDQEVLSQYRYMWHSNCEDALNKRPQKLAEGLASSQYIENIN